MAGVVASLVIATVVAIGTVLDLPGGGLNDRQPPSDQPAYLDNQTRDSTLSKKADKFGIEKLYQSKKRGTTWVSDWAGTRRFEGIDPVDPWFDADHGSARYRVNNGVLAITGDTPRMYVHDPEMKRQWHDVEITVYFRRISDDNTPYAGMTTVTRANHLDAVQGTSTTPCDTRGYGGRFRFDGMVDFEKETSHPQNDTISEQVLWPKGIPKNVWIGYKFVVYDEDDGVHLELYRDMTNGVAGGKWERVARFVDSGNDFGVVPCADNIDPMMKLTASGKRKGSESGKPNISTYFRSDGINGWGLKYKWASVREITP